MNSTIISNGGQCANLFTESHVDRHGPATHRKITTTIHGTMSVDICSKCARQIRSAWDDLVPTGELSKHALTGADRGRTVYVVTTLDSQIGRNASTFEIVTHRALRSALDRAIGKETEAEKHHRWYLLVDRTSTRAASLAADRAWTARTRLAVAERRAAGLDRIVEVVR
jgi:hypothetical protein